MAIFVLPLYAGTTYANAVNTVVLCSGSHAFLSFFLLFLIHFVCARLNSAVNYMSPLHEKPNASDDNIFLDAVHCRHLLDQLPESIQLFKEMKNGRGEITGFHVTFSNARATLMFPERKTGTQLQDAEAVGKGSLFFEKLRSVAESGTESNTTIGFVQNGVEVPYKEKILKFDDSILVLIESTDKATDDEHTKANLLRGISETSADILYIMNINSRQLRFATRKIAEELGYSDEAAAKMNEPLFDLMHEQDLPAMLLHIENMKTAKPGEVREIEYRLRHADGSLRFYRDRNTVYKTDPDGTPIEKLGISQDTTEDYILQARAKKHHSILSQCEELSGSGSWEFDRSTKEFVWSDGMYRLFELPKGTLVKPSIYLDYVVPKDREIAEKLVDVIENHWESSEFNFRIKTESTTRMLRIKTSAVIENEQHEPEKILGTDMDVTTAKKAEENIQGLNKTLMSKNRELEALNSELKTFNDIAANDYKETLRSLYINLENIIKADSQSMSDTGKANVRKAQTAIQKMKLLTEDIVSFSRIPTLGSNISTVDLNEILQQVLHEMGEKIKQNNVRIETENLPVLQGMPMLISLLFYHVLDNAIKFRREGGPDPVITVEGRAPESGIDDDIRYYEISFTDNGIGFDPSEGENLFSIFYRLHDRSQYKGSGIGLAVCRKIMALHGGYITAESNGRQGAAITCYFPAEAAQPL